MATASVSAPDQAWAGRLGLGEVPRLSPWPALGAVAAGVVPVGLVLGIVVWLLASPIAGGIVAAAVVLAGGLAWWAGAPTICLSVLGVRSPAPGELPRVQNLVDGLSLALGVRPPDLRVTRGDGPGPNLAVVGSSVRAVSLVVTPSLERSVARVELEALLAHALAHARRGDAHVLARRAGTLGLVALASRRPVQAVAGRGRVLREQGADGVALAATRYPPALVAALGTLSGRQSEPVDGHSAFAAPLWCVPTRDAEGEVDVRTRALALL